MHAFRKLTVTLALIACTCFPRSAHATQPLAPAPSEPGAAPTRPATSLPSLELQPVAYTGDKHIRRLRQRGVDLEQLLDDHAEAMVKVAELRRDALPSDSELRALCVVGTSNNTDAESCIDELGFLRSELAEAQWIHLVDFDQHLDSKQLEQLAPRAQISWLAGTTEFALPMLAEQLAAKCDSIFATPADLDTNTPEAKKLEASRLTCKKFDVLADYVIIAPSSDVGTLLAGDREALQAPGGLVSSTALLNGVTDFIADRAQKELALWFLDLFGRELCDPNSPTPCMFPKVCAFFEQVGTARASVSGGLVVAFRDDLAELVPRLAEVVAGDRGRVWGWVALAVFKGFERGDDPAGIVQSLTTENSQVFAELDATCSFGTDPLGSPACTLLYVSFATRLAAGKLSVEGFKAKLQEHRIVNVGSFLRNGTDAFLTELNQRFDELHTHSSPPESRGHRLIPKDLARLEPAARSTYIREQFVSLTSYMSAIAESGKRQGASGIGDMGEFSGLLDMLGSARSGDWNGLLVGLTTYLARLPALQSERMPPGLVDAITLAVGIASAKSGDEVKAVLDSVAAPVGSWRLKRKHRLVSIGALAGMAVGGEFGIAKVEGKVRFTDVGGHLAVFAPIGIDISGPIRRPKCVKTALRKCHRSSVGVHFSLIDVGKLLAVRFSGTEPAAEVDTADAQDGVVTDVEPLPQGPELWRVVSPGAFLTFGLGHTPISLFLGASWTPYEREMTIAGEDEARYRHALRGLAGFAVDIVILPFRRRNVGDDR